MPLVLRLPGAAHAGLRVSRPPSAQVDLPATLLDLAGVPAAGWTACRFDPRSRGPRAGPARLLGDVLPPLPLRLERAAVDHRGRFRYIRAPRPELFDDATDPAETKNVSAEHAAAAQAMNAWLDTQVRVGDVAGPAKVDPETMQKLQALGYVGGGWTGGAAAGPLADPKDKVAVFEAYKSALALRREGKDAEAVTALRAVVADSPGMLDAWQAMGLALVRLGRVPEASCGAGDGAPAGPVARRRHLALAKVYEVTGQAGPLEKHAQAAALRRPERATRLGKLGLERPAEEAGGRAPEPGRRSQPGGGLRAGRRRPARGPLRGGGAGVPEGRGGPAVAQAPRRARPPLRAGRLPRARRAEPDAEREFRAEIDALPSTEGRVGLAALLCSQGRDAEARSVLEGW